MRGIIPCCVLRVKDAVIYSIEALAPDRLGYSVDAILAPAGRALVCTAVLSGTNYDRYCT